MDVSKGEMAWFVVISLAQIPRVLNSFQTDPFAGFIGFLLGSVLVTVLLAKLIVGGYRYLKGWIYNNIISPEEFK